VPAGVFSVVTGLGNEAGAALASHPDLDLLVFTGSRRTGSQVAAAAAQNVVKTQLELGGKSPMIVLPGADPRLVLEWAMTGCFFNCGQVCSATSRLLLHESMTAQILPMLVDHANSLKIGDPLGPEHGSPDEVQIGPLVSTQQRDKVLGYIHSALADGAQALCGGTSLPEGTNSQGAFIKPTILWNVPETSRCWQKEIFGPVLCVRSFRTEDEAIAIANATEFGLAAAAMGPNARSVLSKVRAGIKWIDCSQPTFIEAPWGGLKKSGYGVDLGVEGYEKYLASVQVTRYKAEGEPWSWFVK
jgi:betaine-aldehyde dehydrogenase